MFIQLTEPPVCSNRKSHTGRPQKMELIDGQASTAVTGREEKTRAASKK